MGAFFRNGMDRGGLVVVAILLGVAVLVVDASFDLIMETCSRLYAMDRGVLTGMFRPDEFSGPDELAARYLGAVSA